jgi:hypothetical protein
MSLKIGTDRVNVGWPFRRAAQEVRFRRATFYRAAKCIRVKESLSKAELLLRSRNTLFFLYLPCLPGHKTHRSTRRTKILEGKFKRFFFFWGGGVIDLKAQSASTKRWKWLTVFRPAL